MYFIFVFWTFFLFFLFSLLWRKKLEKILKKWKMILTANGQNTQQICRLYKFQIQKHYIWIFDTKIISFIDNLYILNCLRKKWLVTIQIVGHRVALPLTMSTRVRPLLYPTTRIPLNKRILQQESYNWQEMQSYPHHGYLAQRLMAGTEPLNKEGSPYITKLKHVNWWCRTKMVYIKKEIKRSFISKAFRYI